MSGPYAISSAKSLGTVRPKRRLEKAKQMKLSLRVKFRNWLMNDPDDSPEYYPSATLETSSLDSDSMRFNLYKAAGGFVIEIRTYDRRKDENINKMYVITEEKDLGEELGKIITMESMR